MAVAVGASVGEGPALAEGAASIGSGALPAVMEPIVVLGPQPTLAVTVSARWEGRKS